MLIDINGKLMDDGDLHLSPLDSSVYYGLSVYETLFLKDGKIAFFDEHMKRLKVSTDYFYFEYPDVGDIKSRIKELVNKNKLNNARIRLICSGGKYSEISKKMKPSTFITFEVIQTFADSIELCTTSIRKPEPYIYPAGVKVSANHFSLLSYLEARKFGFQEGIMLTDKGHVSEGSYCNLFWKTDNILYTPSLDSSILDGVTRNKILEVCEKLQFTCIQDKFTPEDMNACDALYISSSTRGLLWVSRLDDKIFCKNSDQFKDIIDAEYQKIQEKSLSEWLKD